MTSPPGLPPRPPVTARPGRLQRLKLAEPVRLYCYGVLSAIALALVLVGTITQEWSDALLGIAAAALAVVPGAEAARATVYSPASNLRALVQARQAWDAGSVFDQAAAQ